MLALDDPRWTVLDRGFRPPDGIPGRLRALDADPKSPRWHDVYPYLCQQGGTIYPVTFAAVPHVVASAARLAPADRLDHLLLVGSVENVRAWSQPVPVPPDLRHDYDAAVARSRSLLCETLVAGTWDASEMQHLLATCANLLGHPRLGHVIDALESGPERVGCPRCGADLAALD